MTSWRALVSRWGWLVILSVALPYVLVTAFSIAFAAHTEFESVDWPFVSLLLGLLFYPHICGSVLVLSQKVAEAKTIAIGPVSIFGQVPAPLPGQVVTPRHLALGHTSFRKPSKDAEHGQRCYQIPGGHIKFPTRGRSNSSRQDDELLISHARR